MVCTIPAYYFPWTIISEINKRYDLIIILPPNTLIDIVKYNSVLSYPLSIKPIKRVKTTKLNPYFTLGIVFYIKISYLCAAK